RRVDRVVVGVGAGDLLAFLQVDRDAPVGHRLAAAVRAAHRATQAVERPMQGQRALVDGVALEVRDVVEILFARPVDSRDVEVAQRARARGVPEGGVAAGRVLDDAYSRLGDDRIRQRRAVLGT